MIIHIHRLTIKGTSSSYALLLYSIIPLVVFFKKHDREGNRCIDVRGDKRIIRELQNDPINLDVYFNKKGRTRRDCTCLKTITPFYYNDPRSTRRTNYVRFSFSKYADCKKMIDIQDIEVGTV